MEKNLKRQAAKAAKERREGGILGLETGWFVKNNFIICDITSQRFRVRK
jgi:hypothetical protein